MSLLSWAFILISVFLVFCLFESGIRGVLPGLLGCDCLPPDERRAAALDRVKGLLQKHMHREHFQNHLGTVSPLGNDSHI